jgi:hypothetical protein
LKFKTPNIDLFERVILNDCIFQLIEEFSRCTDKHGLLEYHDMNNLLNVSNRLDAMKIAKYYWKLIQENFLKYYRDEEFRIRLDFVLTRSERQLFLDLYVVNDVRTLGNVHTLHLIGCYGITGVSALGNVHTLNLQDSRDLTDVSALGNVHSLDLSWCVGITDVSALSNVHFLNLRNCNGINDISALDKVHILDLRACDNINNIMSVGNLYILDYMRVDAIQI